MRRKDKYTLVMRLIVFNCGQPYALYEEVSVVTRCHYFVVPSLQLYGYSTTPDRQTPVGGPGDYHMNME